jgi:hypothetical protein
MYATVYSKSAHLPLKIGILEIQELQYQAQTYQFLRSCLEKLEHFLVILSPNSIFSKNFLRD